MPQPTIAALDREIAALIAERSVVATALPAVSERLAAVETELREAEAVFRQHGLRPIAPHPDQAAYLQRLALVGAMMVAAGDKLLKAERQRIEAQGEGLTAADRAARLSEIERAVLRLAARRE